jgi:hypothetical protein
MDVVKVTDQPCARTLCGEVAGKQIGSCCGRRVGLLGSSINIDPALMWKLLLLSGGVRVQWDWRHLSATGARERRRTDRAHPDRHGVVLMMAVGLSGRESCTQIMSQVSTA